MSTKQQLQVYKNRVEELKEKLFDKGYTTDEELDLFVSENQDLFDEYYSTYELMKQLEWDLMTPEEQSKKKSKDVYLN